MVFGRILALRAGSVDGAADERQVTRTIGELIALNPGLEHYGPLHEEWVPAMGMGYTQHVCLVDPQSLP